MNDIAKNIREKKEKIRKEIIRRLRNQNPSLREERSRKIQEELLSSEEFRVSKTVMTYVSLPTEVNTNYLNEAALKQGKRVVVPYIEPNSKIIIASEITEINCLEKGLFGIYQPKDGEKKAISLKEIDLIMVPAIAYDKKNMRLGRGKGYYDKFLSSEDIVSSKTIGLAFHFQVIDSVPSTLHDISVNKVITD